MNRQEWQEDSRWWQAIPLAERLAGRRLPPDAAADPAADSDLAQRRWRRWQTRPPFNDGDYLARRIAANHLTLEEFGQALGDPPEALQSHLPPPPWLQTLFEAYTHYTTPTSLPFPAEALAKQAGQEFLVAAVPLFNLLHHRLGEGVQAILQKTAAPPFNPDTLDKIVFAQVPRRFAQLRMLDRVMVLELRVARQLGLLRGDTPEERFQNFLLRLSQPEVSLAIWRKYPALARQVVIYLTHWLDSRLEFLERLAHDWPAIRATFGLPKATDEVVELDTDLGDPHRNGRAVIKATFRSGLTIIYKPKPLQADVHFQELLTWLNERGADPALRPLRILDCGRYGWVEFIPHQECATVEEVQRFYERQGAYLALLYVLEAPDFHRENVVAAGEHPMLVDNEVIFHPRLVKAGRANSRLDGKQLSNSVILSGLLPRRGWKNEKSAGIDYSGLGANEGQWLPNPVGVWDRPGTDEMRLVYKPSQLPASHNLPRLNGRAVNLLDYSDSLITGFNRMYRLLSEQREALLAEDGPLARFAEDEVRVLLRGSSLYKILLQDSFYPAAALSDGLERDLFFDRLWIGIQHQPFMTRAIPAEHHDLLQGDFPVFLTRPNSRDLWTSANQRIPDFFEETSLSLAQRRLRGLSETDRAHQVWIIRAALATLALESAQSVMPSYVVREPAAGATAGQLIATAAAIGDHLAKQAIDEDGAVYWLGLNLVHGRYWELNRTALDLYGGLPGVALFLAYLGRLTGQARHSQLARQAATTMRGRLARSRPTIKTVGGYDGWGGLIYVFTHLAALWQEPLWLEEATALAAEVAPPLIAQDDHLDVIAGAAGGLLCLLGLHQQSGSPAALDAAVRCGERLLAKAQPMSQGIGWLTPAGGEKALAGFGHGAAGVAYALLQLAAQTSDPRFHTAALEALTYENTLFSPGVGNWADLRPDETAGADSDQPRFRVAWCHGATGVGLGRLASLNYVDTPQARADIEVALQTTLGQGFGRNHCLCHGDLGSLELLLLASQRLPNALQAQELDRLTAAVLSSLTHDGWLCGVPWGMETPGLMTGLAGIGYGLLRLARPDRIPSILLLEPPRTMNNEQ
ncbi:MAG: type 2 lanthipeptide synthetase LanM family protein [Chloroflexota bacterium]